MMVVLDTDVLISVFTAAQFAERYLGWHAQRA